MFISIADVVKVFKGTAITNLYVGEIPSHILDNAVYGMHITVPRSQIFAVYDTCSFFRHGDTGFAITSTGIYFRDTWAEPSYIEWDSLMSIKKATHLLSSIDFNGETCFVFSEDIDGIVKSLVSLHRILENKSKAEAIDVERYMNERNVPRTTIMLKDFEEVFVGTNTPNTQKTRLIRGYNGLQLQEVSIIREGFQSVVYTNGIDEYYYCLGNHWSWDNMVRILEAGRVRGLDKDIQCAWPMFYQAWAQNNSEQKKSCLDSLSEEIKSSFNNIASKIKAAIIDDGAECQRISSHRNAAEEFSESRGIWPRLVRMRDFPNKTDISWFICIKTKKEFGGRLCGDELWDTVAPLLDYTNHMILEMKENKLNNKYRMIEYMKAAGLGIFKGLMRMGG